MLLSFYFSSPFQSSFFLPLCFCRIHLFTWCFRLSFSLTLIPTAVFFCFCFTTATPCPNPARLSYQCPKAPSWKMKGGFVLDWIVFPSLVLLFVLFQPDVLCQNAIHCVLKVIQVANFCLLFTQHGAPARGGKTWNAYRFIVPTENIKDRGSGQL